MRFPFRFSFSVASALVLSSVVGCAASSASSEDANASDQAFSASAGAACSTNAYATALAHYKLAVTTAKDRAAQNICNDETTGDTGTVSSIAGESDAAVKSCAGFQKIIETSSYAQPIRDQLADNLALPYLTGKLAPSKAWSGLSDALPGKTVWGPAPGAWGNESKITFAAGGQATVSKLDTSSGKPIWTDSAASWSLGAAAGGKATVAITVDGNATSYALELSSESGVLDFVFTSTTNSADRFDSLPSECEGA